MPPNFLSDVQSYHAAMKVHQQGKLQAGYHAGISAMSGSEGGILRGGHEGVPPDKHPIQLLGVDLLENILGRDSGIGCSVPPMAAAGVVQRGLMDACEAVSNLAVGACSLSS